MSFSHVILTINSSVSINDYTRLLRILEESDAVEDITFNVD